MYLHLGCETVICEKDIIGIFDLEKTSIGKDTKAFLSHSTKREKVKNVINSENISLSLPKSFVVCEEKVYISQISSRTLFLRSLR